jgi:hypothetical protein
MRVRKGQYRLKVPSFHEMLGVLYRAQKGPWYVLNVIASHEMAKLMRPEYLGIPRYACHCSDNAVLLFPLPSAGGEVRIRYTTVHEI